MVASASAGLDFVNVLGATREVRASAVSLLPCVQPHETTWESRLSLVSVRTLPNATTV